MDQVLQDELGAIVAKEAWSFEDHKEVLSKVVDFKDATGKLRQILIELEEQDPAPKGSAALKIGMLKFMLCRFSEALSVLADGTDNKDRHYFQGQCLKMLHKYQEAGEELQRAKDRGWDGLEVDLLLVETQALDGDVTGAEKLLDKLSGKIGESADFYFLRGLLDDLAGLRQKAADAYTKAIEIDEDHINATFRLAYLSDLYGEEEEAIELYKKCVSQPPIFANALLNLAILHEDAGRYEQAYECLMRLIACNPNHARVKLFLKDIESSMTMFYDEDRAKQIARHNAVLDIPVTDFELSVRARNCLKKMNIRSLGDLVRTTEVELLAYKNFGETSLKEIKEMLTAKNLRLGQAMEEERKMTLKFNSEPSENADGGILSTPLEQIEFSVRARKALEGLSVSTLGDLAAKSEPELLACRNFGQTSLNEIRQRLSDYGLGLRETI